MKKQLFLAGLIFLSFAGCKKLERDNILESEFCTLSTTPITQIGDSVATSGGNIIYSGVYYPITSRGVCWSTAANPTITDSHTLDGTGAGAFVSNITGLAYNTVYYVRAYAINNSGTVFGEELTFNSSGASPLVQTNSNIVVINDSSVTSGGNIISDGGYPITSRGVCWSTAPTPTISDNFTSDGTGIGAFVSTITGLTPNTQYYVRAYSTNSIGTNYGISIVFKTFFHVQIGNQNWMGNNLDVSTYRNGDVILQVTDATQWSNITTGAWCYYNNDPAMAAVYGKLYNWYAVNDPRGLAPTGHHVPSDAEWNVLSTYLGGNALAGGAMKEVGTVHWLSPNIGATNSSGFTGFPGGCRYSDGTFVYIGRYGYWWSATQYFSNTAWNRILNYNSGNVTRGYNDKQNAFSVRCLRD